LLTEIRQRGYGGGRKARLAICQEKLLFILVYLKTYPLQEVLAFHFNMSQGQACQWIHILSEVLRLTLGEYGTERRRQRPSDQEEQKRFYSGKKKTHTVKNNVIVTLGKRRVEYLSGTCEGKKHDKKICDDEIHEFPEGSTLYKDTGFQGYEPAGVHTHQPKKKPRGRELTQEEKEQNSLISSMRIVVEHAIMNLIFTTLLRTYV
jgi:hypothetical protein